VRHGRGTDCLQPAQKQRLSTANTRGTVPGQLLHAQLAYARRTLQLPDARIFILSAQHGLVPLSQQIRPYELALSALPLADREMWGFRVAN